MAASIAGRVDPASASAPASGIVGAAAPIRVLLVDDHALVRSGVRAVLDGVPGIAVVGEAASGEDAILMVESCRPDVVVMDLDMPGGGGLAATAVLTTPDVHPAVLVLTMHAEDARLFEALHAGAAGYLTKDAAHEELVVAVRTAAAGEVYVRPHVGRLLAARLRPQPPPRVDRLRMSFHSLSAREQSVVRLIAEGHTAPEIGRALGITAKTVDTYKHRIQRKIGLSRRTEYIRFALDIDLLLK